ncbi:hypothetical protein BT96DRAFT_1018978 [Gymnopus androsaceus JB14]|uniref:F-box domain-containing protein n=1 Tax=Gymnopus androsaceus JB14 TaxID=1447944 RepID=A0A6A4HMX6_9AGAR|nr:hypothetical protein BT96DRAFT_1018978 [Gymnopus androsaceus JB14]
MALTEPESCSCLTFRPKADTVLNLLKLFEEDLHSLDPEMRTRMETHLSKLRSAIFPVQRLFDDLLLEIFAHCTSAEPLGFGFGPKGMKYNPALNISWVCTHWRQLALGYSKLWSNYSMYLHEDYLHYRGSKLLYLCFERSREHSLSLSLRVRGSEHPFLPLLVRHSYRWKELRIRLGFYELSDDLQPCLKAIDLPALESLEMDVKGDDVGNRILSRSPNLHTFRGSGIIPPNSLLGQPIRNLTYDIHNMSMQTVRRLLAPCVNLQKLSLDRDRGNLTIQDAAYPATLTLPYLKSLSIAIGKFLQTSDSQGDSETSSTSEKAFCISWLTTPELKELSLEYDLDSLECHPLKEIDSFFSRSACFYSLRSLSLLFPDAAYVSDIEMVQTLERLPMLDTLRIRDPKGKKNWKEYPYHKHFKPERAPLTARFIKGLHSYQQSELRPKAKGPLLCHLQRLELIPISRKGDLEFDHRALVETIRSRLIWTGSERHCARLRSVKVHFDISEEEVPDGAYSDLSPFEKAGMEIIITHRQEEYDSYKNRVRVVLGGRGR